MNCDVKRKIENEKYFTSQYVMLESGAGAYQDTHRFTAICYLNPSQRNTLASQRNLIDLGARPGPGEAGEDDEEQGRVVIRLLQSLLSSSFYPN